MSTLFRLTALGRSYLDLHLLDAPLRGRVMTHYRGTRDWLPIRSIPRVSAPLPSLFSLRTDM